MLLSGNKVTEFSYQRKYILVLVYIMKSLLVALQYLLVSDDMNIEWTEINSAFSLC